MSSLLGRQLAGKLIAVLALLVQEPFGLLVPGNKLMVLDVEFVPVPVKLFISLLVLQEALEMVFGHWRWNAY